ncbi:uncharacterized protein LOC144746147 [Ciona intestinalis]
MSSQQVLLSEQTTNYAENSFTEMSGVKNISVQFNLHLLNNRVAEQVIITILIISSLYLSLACLTYSSKNFNLNPKLKHSNLAICFVSCLLFPQCIWFEAEVFLAPKTEMFCVAYTVINATIGTITRTIIYMVLWWRQYALYQHQLEYLLSRFIRMVSRSTFVGIFTFAAVQIIGLSLVPQEVIDSSCRSCEIPIILGIILPMVFTVSSLFQVVLLALTLYPIVLHMLRDKTTPSNIRMDSVVLRLACCTGACVFCDFVFVLSIRLKPQTSSYNLIPVLYGYNSLFNLIAALCSFADYKTRLFPFHHGKAYQPRSNSNNIPTQAEASITPYELEYSLEI